MTGSPDTASSIFRPREGGIASAFLCAATVGILLITRTDVVRYAPQDDLYLVTAGLLALSVPGPVVRPWDLPAQLFYWNAMGWGSGLVLFGMASVGALPIVPIVLAVFGLSFWPREPDSSAPWQAVVIALLGGLLVCWMAWGEIAWDIPFGPGE